MQLLDHVATLVLVIGIAGACAVAAHRVARLTRIPAPVLFLGIGIALAQLYAPARHATSVRDIPVVGTFAIVVILFEGGFASGWSRTRSALWPILALGVPGTLATAALLAAGCHYLLGLPAAVSVLVGVALAPTDPAAVFSVLGGGEIEGRSDIVLEGESGANDPVGIALMLGAVAYYGSGHAGVHGAALDFLLQLVVGVAVGVLLGVVVRRVLGAVDLGSPTLHALAALSSALLVFAAATALHGSGFLAAYVAGLVLGDRAVRGQRATEEFLGVSAALAEIAMFVLLGLTAPLDSLRQHLPEAVAAFALLTFVVRPLVVVPLLTRSGLSGAERAIVTWGGLKGAVPVMLASLPVVAHVAGAGVVYDVVFVAVAASMIVQGSTLLRLVQRFGLLRPPAAARPTEAARAG